MSKEENDFHWTEPNPKRGVDNQRDLHKIFITSWQRSRWLNFYFIFFFISSLIWTLHIALHALFSCDELLVSNGDTNGLRYKVTKIT